MDVRSVYKYARLSTLKGRDVARVVQGMPASEALDMLFYVPRKAARIIEKTLRSAVANAENNHNLDADSLYVKLCTVTSGPSLKRFKARARGGAAPLRKPTSHVTVVVTDEEIQPKKSSNRRNSRKHVSPEKVNAPQN